MKIGIISKWHVHAEEYADCFAKTDYVTIKSVWHEDEQVGKEWAAHLNSTFVADWKEIIADPEIDGVMITSATTQHEQFMVAAAKAGKAIFTEKVLATTNESADRIAAAVKEANIPFCIALRRRTEARVRYAKKLLDEGTIGKLTHMRVRDAHNGATAGWLPPTFYDDSQTGGGAMMDLGAHPMYLTAYFMPNFVSVMSLYTEYTGKGTDDNCVSIIKGANGELAVAETGFVSANSPYSVELNGELGCISFNSLDNGMYVGGKYIPEEEIPAGVALPVYLFADAVENKKELEFDIDSAVALTRLMDAAYRSAKSHKEELV